MKKYFISGVLAIAISAVFTGCSKSTDLYDEGAVQQNQHEQEVAQLKKAYNDAFTKAYGAINPNNEWGFESTGGTTTREAVVSSEEIWLIPENFGGNSGAVNSEGNNADDVAAAFQNNTILRDLTDFDFKNYWLQHINMPKNIKNEIDRLEAYNSNENGGWEAVTHFNAGKNESDFLLDIEKTYFFTEVNTSSKGTTLMKNMGGAGDPANNNKRFRVKMKDGSYNYDYGFLTYNFYDKYLKKTVTEAFLGIKLPKKNGKGSSYWVIRLAPAEKGSRVVAKEGRIFCEDMGANDFDFNDVVFDAKIMMNGDIYITVLAHGGELDITVADQKVTLPKMSNTGIGATAPVQEIFLEKKSEGEPQYTDINDIPVKVVPNGDANNAYDLSANKGAAPQKVCVPIGTLWPDEYVNISRVYSPFSSFVSTASPADWTVTVVPELVDRDLTNND